MAIAWLRLVTRLFDRPDRSFPRFISCMARSTLRDAFGPYRRLVVLRLMMSPHVTSCPRVFNATAAHLFNKSK
jgi:hypothetical protein